MEEDEGVLKVAGVVERLGLDDERLDEGLVLRQHHVGGAARLGPLAHEEEALGAGRLVVLQNGRGKECS